MPSRRNTYTPGEPLPTEFHAVGRPVTFFHGFLIEAGVIARVTTSPDATVAYDVRVSSGGTFRNVHLGTLMNPQPNTFVFAP